MIDTKKYLDLQYKFNGRLPEEGVDCLGLLFLVYQDQGWDIVTSDGKEIEHNWFEIDRLRFFRYLLKHWDKETDISELKEGDVLLWQINGESHTAIYLGYNRFLSTYPELMSRLGITVGGYVFVGKLSVFNAIPGVEFICGFKRRVKDGRTDD